MPTPVVPVKEEDTSSGGCSACMTSGSIPAAALSAGVSSSSVNQGGRPQSSSSATGALEGGEACEAPDAHSGRSMAQGDEGSAPAMNGGGASGGEAVAEAVACGSPCAAHWGTCPMSISGAASIVAAVVGAQ